MLIGESIEAIQELLATLNLAEKARGDIVRADNIVTKLNRVNKLCVEIGEGITVRRRRPSKATER